MISEANKNTITSMIAASLLKLSENEEFINSIVEQVTTAVQEVFSKKISALNSELNKLKQENRNLKEACVNYENKVDDLEQYTRRNNIRIFGLPESKAECIEDSVENLFRDKLNVNIPVCDIDRCHRLGKPNNNSARPVIVKFISYRVRQKVFQEKKKLKDSGITIREDLTKPRLSLLKEAVEKYSYKNVWTMDGRITVHVTSRGKNYKYYITKRDDFDKIPK